MNRVLVLLLLFTITSCSEALKRVPASFGSAPYIHGLKDVEIALFDRWTEGLYKSDQEKKSVGKVSDQIVAIFHSTSTAEEFLEGVLKLGIHTRYRDWNDYKTLSDKLFAIRKHLRGELKNSPVKTRQALLVLEVLAEEAIYAGLKRFGDDRIMKYTYHNDTSSCKGRVASLNGIKICQGDIVNSKGGAGSSSFLARIADYPGNFSHATMAYVEPKSGKLLFPESYIEDGVKLRDPHKDYVDHRKAKLFVYRAKSPSTIAKGIRGADRFVEKMKETLGTSDLRRLAKEPSYIYDFSMEANDPSAYFCNEIPYRAYIQVGAVEDNPYAKSYWSSVTDNGRGFFLENFLGVGRNFPAPSDIELNEQYELIAMQFDPKELAKDRMVVAIVDVMLDLMENNPQLVMRMSRALGEGKNVKLDPEVLKEKYGTLFSQYGVDLDKMADKVPPHISLNQFIFFGLLNEIITPKIKEQLVRAESRATAKGEVLKLSELRAMAKQSAVTIVEAFVRQI